MTPEITRMQISGIPDIKVKAVEVIELCVMPDEHQHPEHLCEHIFYLDKA